MEKITNLEVNAAPVQLATQEVRKNAEAVFHIAWGVDSNVCKYITRLLDLEEEEETGMQLRSGRRVCYVAARGGGADGGKWLVWEECPGGPGGATPLTPSTTAPGTSTCSSTASSCSSSPTLSAAAACPGAATTTSTTTTATATTAATTETTSTTAAASSAAATAAAAAAATAAAAAAAASATAAVAAIAHPSAKAKGKAKAKAKAKPKAKRTNSKVSLENSVVTPGDPGPTVGALVLRRTPHNDGASAPPSKRRKGSAGVAAVPPPGGSAFIEYVAASRRRGGRGWPMVLAAEAICRREGLNVLYSAADLLMDGNFAEPGSSDDLASSTALGTSAVAAHRRWGFHEITEQEWKDAGLAPYNPEKCSVLYMKKDLD